MIAAIKSLTKLMSRKERLQYFTLFIPIIISAIIETSGIVSVVPFMWVISNPNVVNESNILAQVYQYFAFSNTQSFILFLGIIFASILILGNVFNYLLMWLKLRFSHYFQEGLSERLFTIYLNQPYKFFLERNSATLTKNIMSESKMLLHGVMLPMLEIASRILTVILILTVIAIANFKLSVIIASIVISFYMIAYRVIRSTMESKGKEGVRLRKRLFKTVGEAISGIKYVKLYGLEDSYIKRYHASTQRQAHNFILQALLSSTPRYIMESIAFGGIVSIMMYLLYQHHSPAAIVSLLALYVFAGYRLLPHVQSIYSALSGMKVAQASLKVIRDEFDSAYLNTNIPLAQEKDSLTYKDKFDLINVSFSYGGREEQVLNDINLSIPANSLIGFVGKTGSGKTTTADIICGLLLPVKGHMVADGKTIEPLHIRQWQRHVAYVPQDIYLNDNTVANNIAFGVPEEEIDQDKVRQAAKLANLDDFVMNQLSEGYETFIGERGVRLSGGQAQRIAIARALYREPDLLIFDEATSSLDNLTEKSIMDNIAKLTHQKTIIIIAHRLSTVEKCDTIYLFEDSRIVDSGSYQDLLYRNINFQNMVNPENSQSPDIRLTNFK